MAFLEILLNWLKIFACVTMETVCLICEVTSLCVKAALRHSLYLAGYGRVHNLSDCVCLITGSGRGLGRQLAVKLAKHKPAKIILWDIRKEDLEETKRIIDVDSPDSTTSITYDICDITNHDDVELKIKSLRNEGSTIDILLNNAGVLLHNGNFHESDMSQVKRVIDVNLTAQINLIHQVLPDMLAKGKGNIVQISSITSRIALPFASAYTTSKFAVSGFMDCLRFELLGTGVHCTTMNLNKLNTVMFEGFSTRMDWLIRELNVDYVAKETIQAMMTNTQTVTLPRLFYPVCVIKSILPDSAWNPFIKFLKLNIAMTKVKKTQ